MLFKMFFKAENIYVRTLSSWVPHRYQSRLVWGAQSRAWLGVALCGHSLQPALCPGGMAVGETRLRGLHLGSGCSDTGRVAGIGGGCDCALSYRA